MNTTTCPPDSGEISPTAQRTIRRALTLLERQLREPGEAFTSCQAVRDWLRLQLTTLEREVFMALFLDNQHRLIAHETLFTGTINHTQVHPREVIKA
ncbi:TPA: JAB domain-containing protein, partial [Raoultella planticola]